MSHCRGLGIVYNDGVYSAIVRYDLPMEDSRGLTNGKPAGEKRRAIGSIVIMQGDLPLNRTLVLRTEDGKDLSFEARPTDNFGTHATRYLALLEDETEL